jgi:hypothetical protein
MKILMCIKLYYHAPFIHVWDCSYDKDYFIKLQGWAEVGLQLFVWKKTFRL